MSNQWAWGWRPEQLRLSYWDHAHRHDLSRKAGATVEPGHMRVLADIADLRGERGNRYLTV